jgi:hypothetical protein
MEAPISEIMDAPSHNHADMRNERKLERQQRLISVYRKAIRPSQQHTTCKAVEENCCKNVITEQSEIGIS